MIEQDIINQGAVKKGIIKKSTAKREMDKYSVENLKIHDFLASYPFIDGWDPSNVLTDNSDEVFTDEANSFYEELFLEKEFNELRLDKTENLPDKIGEMMKHQKFVTRFMSNVTPYSGILLMHNMGLGKTCSSISIVENNKNDYKGAIILAKNTSILKNFENELLFRCTDGIYIPENYHRLSDSEKVHRVKKKTSYYSMHTFVMFAKIIQKINNHSINKNFSNRIIIIDEIHNITPNEKEDGINVYEQLFKFLHNVSNCKIILMSGTPMKDGPEEIASVMNLILPMSEQLPMGQKFIKEYMTTDENDGINYIKPSKVNDLVARLKGRVSYLKNVVTGVSRRFIGKKIGTLKHFIVDPDYMSKFQTTNYVLAYKKDTENKKGGWRSNARQASLFVFPDGSYGEEGFKKYVNSSTKNGNTSYSLKPTLLRELSGNSHEETIKNIERFSSKYASTIRDILNAKERKESCFVYCEFVKGGGMILFSLLLKLVGFTRSFGNEQKNDSDERFIMISNITSTKISQLINRFNQEDNIHGDIIRVIIGSKVLNEGYTIKNTLNAIVLTPHWNYSETDQALSRVYRLNAHNGLVSKGIAPVINVHLKVSLPVKFKKSEIHNKPPELSKAKSIDLIMYKISEEKDVSIKNVEYIIKKTAVDCANNYRRNRLSNDFKGKRECEYRECNYTCVGIDMSLVKQKQTPNNLLSNTNYNLFYSNKEILKSIEKIKNMFRFGYSFSFKDIYQILNTNTHIILYSLGTIIDEMIPIKNNLGITSYLKETDNIYFLTPSLSSSDNILNNVYAKFPELTSNETFDTIYMAIYNEYYTKILNTIVKRNNIEDTRILLNKLPNSVKQQLLETSLLSKKHNIADSILRRNVLEAFSDNFIVDKDDIYAWIMEGEYRQLPKDGMEMSDWKKCKALPNIRKNKTKVKIQSNTVDMISPDQLSELNDEDSYMIDLKNTLEQTKLGYYGQVSDQKAVDSVFCLRDVRDTKPQPGHRQKSGKVCKTWKKVELNQFFKHMIKTSNTEKFKLDTRKYIKYTRKQLLISIRKIKNIENVMTDEEIEQMSDTDIRQYLAWSSLKINEMCQKIHKFLVGLNHVIEDKNCGTANKRKVKR